MALSQQLQDLRIKIVGEGFEDLDGLAKGLGKVKEATKSSDASIKNAVKSIKAFALENRKTTDSIRGQIQAFTELRNKALITGNAYKGLSKEISTLNQELNQQLAIEKSVQQKRTFNRRLRSDWSLAQITGSQGQFANQVKNARSYNLRINELQSSLGELTAEELEKLGLEKELNITGENYQKVLQNLASTTNNYSASIERQKNIAAEALAMDRQRFLLDKQRLETLNKIPKGALWSQGMGPGMGSLGQISTSTMVPSYKGMSIGPSIPGIGPVPKDTRLQDKFKNQSWIERFLQSHIETSNWQKMMGEKRSMPLPLFTTPTKTFADNLYDPKAAKKPYGPQLPAGLYEPGYKPKFQITEAAVGDLKFPKTISGYSAKIAELKTNLNNLTLATPEYKNGLKELNSVEKEFNNILEKSNEELKEKSNETKKLNQNLLAPAGGVKDFVTRQQRDILGKQKFDAPSVKKQKKSIDDLRRSIKQNTNAIKGSINAVTAQKAGFEKLRAGLDPASAGFKKLTADIQRADKALARMQQRGQKFSGGNLAKGFGAVLSASYFGGPAGFLGAGLGMGVNALRPGGNLASGAIGGGLLGSQIFNPVAQFVGGSTTYASDISKSQIALRKATEVKDEDKNVIPGLSDASFEKAMKTAKFAIEELNIPQEVAIKGMTRLSAAVIGAGGNVDNASEAFLSITSAIKGTAGNTEDVKAAITAMVQIFSKGKVSAEELSGQLGERFPAAVTKFADANNLRADELQKSLKDGTVGLDMLSKFVASLGKEFLPVALEIAGSTEEAGARMTVMFNALRKSVGDSLKPAGAEFQSIAANVLKQALPALIKFAESSGKFLLKFAEVLKATIRTLKTYGDVLIAVSSGFVIGKVIGGIGILISSKFALLRVIVRLRRELRKLNLAWLKSPAVRIAAILGGVYLGYTKAQRGVKSFIEEVADGTKSIEQADEKLIELKKGLESIQEAEKMGINPLDRRDYLKLGDVDEKLSIGRDQRIVGGPAPEIIWGGLRADEIRIFIEMLEEAKKVAGDTAVDIEALWKELTGGKVEFPPWLKDGGDDQGPLAKFRDQIMDTTDMMENLIVGTFKKMEDALVDFVMTGKLNFKEFARSVIADITRIAIRQAIIAPIVGTLFPGPKEAKGGVYSNGIRQFKKGGIVDAPTYFPFAKGVGLMGEAGPEAIMPLKRGKGGRLGVESSGGGGVTTVNVSVDAKGTKVEGDGKQMAQLGKMLGAAVEAAIVKERRPGGLLT